MFLRRPKLQQTEQPHYFYFNLADESHAKILEKTRKVDPMQLIERIVDIDEY